MSMKANPTAIGAFIVGAVLLFISLLLVFGTGEMFKDSTRHVLYFDGSLQGLRVGAPVTMKGVKIGEVKKIRINVYPGDHVEILTEVQIDVTGDNSIYVIGDEEDVTTTAQLIEDGLRAQLGTQSLLTGLLYIELDFFPDSKADLKNLGSSPYVELPTMPTELEQFTQALEKVDLNKISETLQSTLEGVDRLVNHPRLPVLVDNVDKALVDIQSLANSLESDFSLLTQDATPVLKNSNALLVNLNKELPIIQRQLEEALSKIEGAGESADFILSDDSPLMYELIQASQSIGDAADQLRALSQTLETKPESIIKGK